MKTMQGEIISGNVWNTYTEESQDYTFNRLPYLGQEVCFRDGSKYRFVSTLEDIEVGEIVCQQPALTEYDGKLKAASVGATVIALTAAAVTADLYAGGTLVLTDSGTAWGQVYKINSHTKTLTVAGDVGAVGDVEITLDAPLRVAIAATDDCTIIPSKWKNVTLGDAVTNPVGVCIAAVDPATDTGTTSAWMWVQTKGPCGVSVETVATATAGKALMAVADGQANLHTADYPIIGVVLLAGTADDDLVCTDLCIE